MALDDETQKRLAQKYVEGMLPPQVKTAVERQIANGNMKPIKELVDVQEWRYITDPPAQAAQDLGDGVQNLIGELGVTTGLLDRGTMDVWKDKQLRDKQQYLRSIYGSSPASKVYKFGMDVAPWAIATMGTALPESILGKMLLGGAEGGIAGATQMTYEPGLIPIGKNLGVGAGIGGAAGAAIPLAFKGLNAGYQGGKKAARYFNDWMHGRKPAIQSKVFQGIDAKDFMHYKPEAASYQQKQIRKAVQAGDNLGAPITPAEAAPKIYMTGKAQGDLARSAQGAAAQTGNLTMRQLNERKAFKALKDAIGPSDDMARIETKSQQLLQDNVDDFVSKSRQKVTEKYQPFEHDMVPSEVFGVKMAKDASGNRVPIATGMVADDPILSSWYQSFTKTPEYKSIIAEGYHPGSYKILNELKKFGDKEVSRSTRESGQAYTKGLGVQNTKAIKKLKDALDLGQNKYPEARDFASKEIQARQALQEGPIGTMANLKTSDASGFAQQMFGGKYSNKTIGDVRKVLDKSDKSLFPKLLRGWMDDQVRGIDSNDLNAASTVYNKLLKDDKKFKMLISATKGNPKAQKFLLDMKRAWPGTINRVTGKTGSFKEQANLLDPRNWLKAFTDKYKQVFGDTFEKEANDYIFSGKWLPDLEKRWANGAVTKSQTNIINKIAEMGSIKPQFTTPAARVLTTEDPEDYTPIDFEAEEANLKRMGRQ